jgi:hypothetical protein
LKDLPKLLTIIILISHTSSQDDEHVLLIVSGIIINVCLYLNTVKFQQYNENGDIKKELKIPLLLELMKICYGAFGKNSTTA